MDIGSKIKSSRIAADLTQESLAEKLNTTRQTVSSWENNRSYPDIISLVEMSNIFGTSLDEFIKNNKEILDHFDKVTDTIKRKNKVKTIIEFSAYLFVWIICFIIFYLTRSHIGGAKDDIIMFFVIPLTVFTISVFIGNDNSSKTLNFLMPVFFGTMHLVFNLSVSFIQTLEHSLFFHNALMNFGTSITFFLISASVSALGTVIGNTFKTNNKKY